MQKFQKVVACLCASMATASATEIRFDGYRFMGGHNCIEFDLSHDANTVTINKILINQTALNPDVINEITLIIPGEVKKQSSLYLLDDLACIGAQSYTANSSVRFPEWDVLYAQTCIKERAFEGLALDNLKLKVIFEANNKSVQLPTDCSELFKGSRSVTEIDFSGVDPNPIVTSTKSMFELCNKLERITFGNFNTSNVTDMQWMFNQCEKLVNLNLSNFNTRNVTDMTGMFERCESLVNLDLGNFDTRKVQNMMFMFKNCSNLIDLNLHNFETQKVYNMTSMFENCSSLTLLDLRSFNTHNVEYMPSMFKDCKNLWNLNLTTFNTINVRDVKCMFENCSNLELLDLRNFRTYRISKMEYMFKNCSRLTGLILGSMFDKQKLKNSKNALSGCDNLKGID